MFSLNVVENQIFKCYFALNVSQLYALVITEAVLLFKLIADVFFGALRNSILKVLYFMVLLLVSNSR